MAVPVAAAEFFVCGFTSANLISYDCPEKECDIRRTFNVKRVCCFVPLCSDLNLKTSEDRAKLKPIDLTLFLMMQKGISWNFTGHLKKHEEEFLTKFGNLFTMKVSDKRIAAVDSEGRIFVKMENSSQFQNIFLQGGYGEEMYPKVADFAIEDNCLLILDHGGVMYSSGIEIPLPGIKICSIGLGKEHCLALSENGEVFSWGSGMKGQLGNGMLNLVDFPDVLQALQGIFIKEISCGGWHSAALSSEGDIYMWGWNDSGQLGFPSKSLRSDGIKWHAMELLTHTCSCIEISKKEIKGKRLSQEERRCKSDSMVNPLRNSEYVNVQMSPKLLDYWKTEFSVKNVACGVRHSIFLLEDGSAWTVGWNKYGQLGIGSTESKDEPELIALYPVSDIFAGGWNTGIQMEAQSDR